MASTRRMGPETSATRVVLMDAVESVMREQGYGALSARSIATRAGLKHQLVYYYFKTMDELLLATYRRRTGRMMARIQQAFAAEHPLQALWTAYSDPDDAALTIEYMALANHNEAIRTETVTFGEQLRTTGLDKLHADGLDPSALTMVLRSIASVIGMETALGISGGHAETRGLVERCIGQLEPRSA